MKSHLSKLILGLLIGFTVSAAAETLTVPVTKDSSYRAGGGWPAGWYGSYAGTIRISVGDSSYFHADLSAIPVPAGFRLQINSATLNYYVYTTMEAPATMTLTNQAFRISSTWIEGNPVGDNPAGWDTTTPPPPVAEGYGSYTLTGVTSTAVTGWKSLDVKDLVQAWTDNVYPNYGVQVVQTAGDWVVQGVHSRQNSNVPYFSIDYTLVPVAYSCILPVIKDSSYRQSGGWPYGWYSSYYGTVRVSNSGVDNAYFYADLSGIPVPPGQRIQITSATLKYYVSGAMDGNYPLSLTDQAFRITSDWQEGNNVGDTGWDLTTLPPTTGEGYGSYSLTAVPQSAVTGWKNLDVTTLAQGWVNGTFPNQGVMVQQTNSDYVIQALVSREGSAAQRPYFLIAYTLVPSGNDVMTIPVDKDSTYDSRGWFSNYMSYHLYTSLYAKSYFYSDILSRIKEVNHQTTVYRATLNYYVYNSRFGEGGISLPFTLQAFRISGNYPAMSEGPGITDDGVTQDHTTAPPAIGDACGAYTGSTETGWVRLDVTDQVKKWANGTNDNFGLMVTQTDGYLPQGLYSREYTDPTLRPYFSVEYKIERPQWETQVTRGHRVLVNRGLQIQGEAFAAETGHLGFSLSRFNELNFTTPNIWTYRIDPSWAGPAPGPMWSRYCYTNWPGTEELQPQEIAYLPNMITYQYNDDAENDLTNPANVQAMKAWFALNRQRYPNVINCDDQSPTKYSFDTIKAYIMEAKPDLVLFNQYPFDGNLTGGSPTSLYANLQKYRQLTLAGLDGNGNQPIPFGIYTQSWLSSGHVVSESEIRLNEFGAWSFGAKLICAFFYNAPPSWWGLSPILFNGEGDSSPTPQFYQMAAANGQSKNLGPALVRLLSTDVRFIPGQHAVKVLGVIIRTDNNDVPAGITSGIGGADPYITGISASNSGGKNDNKRGDVIVGFFKPLHESFDGDTYTNEKYFMITNGLSDSSGSAAETRQNIHITFTLPSTITSLQRLSRTTGQVEVVPLISEGNGNYSLDLVLDGGTGDLFKYNTGAPFVGATPAVAPVLSVTPAFQSVGASTGSTTFNVANAGTGSMPWSAQVTAGGDWLQITGGSGTNAGTITANYQANTGAQRTGTIHVDAGSAGVKDVTVIQVAGQVQQPTVHGTVTYTDYSGYPFNTVTIEIRNGATVVETHSALALTGSTGSKTYTFTTSLTGPYTLAIVKNAQTGWKEAVQTGVILAADTTVNFTVTHALAGDASMDNKVDVSDLGILAANYGQTGKTWNQGDFSGDGKVDVSDLGILAAHYGQGSGGATQAGDLHQDMKAIGFSIDSNTGEPADTQKTQPEENPVAKNLGGCGSAGLPLVAGLLLAALWLTGLKIKE